MVIRPVFRNYRPQSAGSETVNLFDGKKAVLRYFSGLDFELAGSLVDEEAGTSYVTGCTRTNGEHMLAGGFKPECLIE
jgi:hypothetical protein